MKASQFLLEFWILPGLTITTVASITLLVLHLIHWQGSENVTNKIANNNTPVVVSVQIISHILGMVMLQSICALLKIHFRSSTVLKPVSFEYTRFVNALSAPRPLFSENWSFTAGTILFTVLSTVPGAIWSGAIAPSLTTRRVPATIRVPSYPVNDPSSVFQGDDVQNANGDFSFDSTRFTTLLTAYAQQASSHNVSQPNQTPHAKFDNSGYVYLTRSFGAGSIVGLIGPSIGAAPVTYSYIEPGIVAHVSCLKNDSSAYEIESYVSGYNDADWSATMGSTAGFLPNGDKVNPAWLFGTLYEDLFAVDQVYEQNLRQSQTIMAAAGNTWPQYQFNNVQCLVNFTSHDIQVNVDVGRKTIRTNVLGETAWPAYGDFITPRSMQALRQMSVADNAYAGSRVGRALWVNAAKLRYLTTGNYSVVDIPEGIILQSVSDFIVSVFENMLVAIAACRVECAHTTQEAMAGIEIRSFVFGAPRFMYIVSAINFALVFAAIYMVLVRKAWTRTVELDFTDVVHVALNASRGGTELYNQLVDHSSWTDAKFALEHVRWRWPTIVAANTPSVLNIDIPMTDTARANNKGPGSSAHDVGLLSSARSSVNR